MDNISLSEKFILLNMKLDKWKLYHSNGLFNVNGKNSYELTFRQFTLLSAVSKLGLTTLSELEDIFKLSKSNLSLSLSKLEKGGYIEKRTNEDTDRRKVILYVTKKGEKSLQYAYDLILNEAIDFFAQMNDQKKENFLKGIDLINSVL